MINRIHSNLKQFGELRDSLLVLIGGLYILGYIVRSINGLKNNLGFLPAFESQYLIAGIVPAIVILVFYLLILGTWRIKIEFSNWIDSGSYKIIIPLLIIAAYLISMGQIVHLSRGSGNFSTAAMNFGLVSSYLLVGMIFIKFSAIKNAWENLLDKKHSWFSKIYFLIILIITAPYYLFITIIDRIISGTGEQIKEFIDPLTVFTIIFIALYTVAGLEYFVSNIYPQIPQEFGGARPRCALLDVKSIEISSELKGALFHLSSNTTNTDIIRSNQVDVYFSSNEFMLVKPHSKTAQSEITTYEIPKSVVQVVTWCE